MQRICLLFTGGTIAMTQTEGGLRPPDAPLNFREAMPELEKLYLYFDEQPQLAGYDVLFNIDSSNMTPAHWQQIARAVYARLPEYDGFVITHGTDTMPYTAAALAFMLRGLNKPVVLTGSQSPLTGSVVIDARNNLINAFRAAALGAERHLPEVVVMFGSQLLRGVRAAKMSVFDFEAFASFNAPPLGKVGLRFQLHERDFLPMPTQPPTLADALDENVALVKITPGMSPRVLDAVIDTGIHGLVIEAFGAGNLPNDGAGSLLPSVARAQAAGVVVVICTQAQIGAADLYYLTGVDFIRAGAISAYDMTPSAALVKLMWLLGQHPANMDAVRRGFRTDYAGEVDIRLIGD